MGRLNRCQSTSDGSDEEEIMRDTKANNTTPVAPWRRALTITLWVLQVLLAFQFAGGGFMKLSGDPVMVDMFATIGAGQWLRFLVGALEVAGAIGLLIPRLAGLAALGLTCLMAGAVATNLFILRVDSTVAIVLLLIAALIAWGRWSQTRRLIARRAHADRAQEARTI
jgi:uncharacterized membrane protein YphA (DoxX/SURF4 family)